MTRTTAPNESSAGVSVILPTYNEGANIGRVLPLIEQHLNHLDRLEIIVVDDDSPDNTAGIAGKAETEARVRVIVRKDERGLASAVVRGLGEATYQTIVVMDADLQHPPEKVRELIEAIDAGADLAIGSRFVKGGSTGEFTIFRELMSLVANGLAKLLFRSLWGVSDIQSGFFAIRKGILPDTRSLDPIGYKILLELLIKSDAVHTEEIAYTFREREEGDSQMGLLTVVNYVRHLLRLKVGTVRFALRGIIRTVDSSYRSR